MPLESGDAAQSRTIRIPKRWIEQCIEQAHPSLSIAAIEQIEGELAGLHGAADLSLGMALDISYSPGSITSVAEKFGMDDASLIQSLNADFSNGVAFQWTDWRTGDGRSKAWLVGARWRAVVRPQAGRQSGATLLVLESVQPQQIPTRQPTFRPTGVRLAPI